MYQGTQIVCNFSVVELDGDLFQNLVNCVSVALLDSPLKCRCLPVAVSVLQDFEKSSVIDPRL